MAKTKKAAKKSSVRRAVRPAAKKPAPAASSAVRRPARKGKGTLSLYFSFFGAISKELYTGALTVLGIKAILTTLVLTALLWPGVLPSSMPAALPDLLVKFYIVIMAAFAVSIVALTVKRARTLGVSKLTGVLGWAVAAPYYTYYKNVEREAPADGEYASNYRLTKAIGAFFSGGLVKALIWIVLAALGVAVLNYLWELLFTNINVKFMDVLLGLRKVAVLVVVNALFAIGANYKIIRSHAELLVRVLSLAAYTYVVAAITGFYTAYVFFQALITSVQNGNI